MSSAFESFVVVHQYQLSTIPKELWETLFMKLGEDYLDAGNFVELHQGDRVEGYSLHVKADQCLKKHSDVFLIDHAWTTSPETAKEELRANANLLNRLENLMDIVVEDAPADSDDKNDEDIKPDSDLIDLVAEQANVSKKEAELALIAENNEIINAITRLTIDPDVKAEADRLQEQVMGQMLASGRPQEKEEKENKERLERREKREKEWVERRIEAVYSKMWSFIQTYTYSVLQQDGQLAPQTAWYVNDEVGSAICHSEDPNVVCVPFIFSRGASGMIPYSVFFPIKDIEGGEIITCDLLPKTLDREIDKVAYLYAIKERLLSPSIIEEKRKDLIQHFETEQARLTEQTLSSKSSKSSEITSTEKVLELLKKNSGSEKSTPIHVYTDTPFIQQFLKLENVVFTNDQSKADIIWSSSDFKDWDAVKPHQIVNQIPNEQCITFKQNLAELICKTYGSPSWFPRTYNLMTQLAEFVGDYLNCDKTSSENNLWITKPWNMARSLGLDVTRNLAQIIRQRDGSVPKIVQRYITNPCLYNGKKFDLRYIVLVRRTEPELVACVYNMFWTRLANKKFSLDDLNDYERHFTVMNYSNYQMTQLDHKSFIFNLEKQHGLKWDKIQKDINAAIKDILVAATSTEQPLGLAGENAKSSNTFSLYGFDVMLTDDFKPVILEVNFSPDCTRACQVKISVTVDMSASF
ncbi:tubulin-tyrosine ligase family-domain-containing protein [Mycotypha africana]|uniref:tubulin-tyrosine ligase family-domain-containing protein n=1 Tax=Mycotypha africana TaxID=64632 RepID=UPI0023019BEB|nr:tubulin-tyrosine ligase family-domain-containing protein [Mycotypha africana]KAI8973286.1 tubulin-tyrosine ligase family-domain-containing protein [Mycotypha africana]